MAAERKRVYRFVVPVDDEAHTIPDGKVVHVDTRGVDYVEVWLEFSVAAGLPDLPVRVFGTGHDVPADAVHLGTALSERGPVSGRGALVWHLYAVKADD